MNKKDNTTAVVLAAGQGRRMHSSVQKQYMLLQDKPLVYYALKTFQDSFIDEIILVTGKDEEDFCRNEIVDKYNFSKVKKIVEGGVERYHSVANGLKAADNGGYVFIHDGARPFLTQEILQRAYAAVKEYHACVVGMPAKDTIKVSDDNGFTKYTPDRKSLWQIQTPQAFNMEIAKEAYDRLLEKEEELKSRGVNITDDAMVIETLLKHPIKLIEGSYNNIKITTPEDLDIACYILKQQIIS